MPIVFYNILIITGSLRATVSFELSRTIGGKPKPGLSAYHTPKVRWGPLI